MELRHFIKEALTDILGGVGDAQSELDRSYGQIIPQTSESFKSVDAGISAVQAIEFEVTVSTNDKSGNESKLSVVAAVVGGSIKGDSAQSKGHVGKLSFKVPVKFPSKIGTDAK
jgi:hypothetical protein